MAVFTTVRSQYKQDVFSASCLRVIFRTTENSKRRDGLDLGMRLNLAPPSTSEEHDVPIGTDLLFSSAKTPEFVIGIEICEDAWVHRPPASDQISAGATVICNVSASNFVVGKAETRRLLMRAQSQRGHCAYLYVAAGPGESSTDLAFDADAFICENGRILRESKRFERDSQLIEAEIDLHRLVQTRRRRNTFSDCSNQNERRFRTIQFNSDEVEQLSRHFPAHPFLPAHKETLARRCWEVFEIQSNALRDTDARHWKSKARPGYIRWIGFNARCIGGCSSAATDGSTRR